MVAHAPIWLAACGSRLAGGDLRRLRGGRGHKRRDDRRRGSYAGVPPPVRTLTVTKEQEVCGKDQADERLVIGADKKVANAVVSIAAISRGQAVSDAAPVLDQKGCHYSPHVLLVPAGVAIKVLNGDGILHNVHTHGRANPPVNVAQPQFKKEISIQFDEPETVAVKCDTHEWMSGVIVVMEHPYYAKTDEKGAFRLNDVPPGEYTVDVWHETLGQKSATVTVGPGKETRVDFALGGE
jgi:plastocyanin